VDRARQRDPILDHIWATVRNRPDMSCLGLGSTTAIDHPKSGDCTGTIIRFKNLTSEGGIANFPICQNLHNPPFLLFNGNLQYVRRLSVGRTVV
jgi:hypothetical protein